MEQASNAKEVTDTASELESLTLAINGAILMSDNYVVEERLLNSELANYFDTYSVSGDTSSGFLVTIGSNTYVVTSSGEINPSDWYGDGTATEYYISSALQLCELSDIVNYGTDDFSGKTVYLTCDIDMTEAYDTGIEFDVIGDDEKIGSLQYFQGTFDGLNHEISGFKSPVNSLDVSGMFYCVDGGNIKNLGIVNSTFSGGASAPFGHFIEESSIENCWSVGNEITGTSQAAGIVCGCVYGSTIKNCYNSSTVTSLTTSVICDNGAGGIVASSIDGDSGNIINCYNTGIITAENGCAGGIAGYDEINSFIGCYNTGTINGLYSGGIVAYADDVPISNCYNVGTISETGTYYGGIIGYACYDSSEISNSYCLTNFYGYNDNTYTDVTNVMTSCEENVSTSDMKSSDMITKLNTGIDTTTYSSYVQDTNNINDGYPILSWQ